MKNKALSTAYHWEKIGRFPHHGICVHISSLRAKNSSGIGEILDLLPLIDWCNEIGFDILQLLPINDSGLDPSPYNPQSSLAIDPIYISLEELGLSDPKLFSPLNASEQVLRKKVLANKLILLKKFYEKTFSKLKDTWEYQTFYRENPWLNSYCIFKALKEEFLQKHWIDWPQDFAFPDPLHTDFYAFLQFHAFRQLKIVSERAEEKGVFLMGDISILVNLDSADVWSDPSLFDASLKAGAPPDDFNPKGQNWGFPLFHRENMRKSGFSWWRERLRLMERFFSLYRIDHVIGLFRIWGIPEGASTKEGFFVPQNRSEWKALGSELLEMMLASSSMFPIAEDLGDVSKEIYDTLDRLQIPGTKLIQMEWEKGSFFPLEDYAPNSLTSVSTHDTPTLDLWWRSYPQQAAAFAKMLGWHYEPILSAEKRFSLLKKAHATPSLFHINLLQEYLALFPELVWINPEEERINIPGSLIPKNWTYRYRAYVEEIVSHSALKKKISSLIPKSPPL